MGTQHSRGTSRSRWAAIGAAVAVTLGVGGLAVTHAANPAGSSGFVPITPCRLFDTRADEGVGPRRTPLAGNETFVQQVTGTIGNCTVPAGVAGIAMNVTSVNGTAASFLTVWPSDATRPQASSLNWVGGAPATPNKVDVKLSADGKVSFFSNAGTVDVIADVVGFYAVIEAGAPTGTRLSLDPGAFHSEGSTPAVTYNFTSGRLEGVSAATPSCGITNALLPQGVTVTNVTAHVQDNNITPGSEATVRLFRNPITQTVTELMSLSTTSGSPGVATLTDDSITGAVVDNTQFTYFVAVCGLQTNIFLFDVLVNFA